LALLVQEKRSKHLLEARLGKLEQEQELELGQERHSKPVLEN
jgi:hypothetical protein